VRTQPRLLIDIAVNEFNYILDINLKDKRVEQIVTNIPQINSGITYDKFLGTFGSNVPLADKGKCNLFRERILNATTTQDFSPFVAEIRFSNYINPNKFDWSSVKCIFDTSREDVHVFVISRDITVEKENELEVIRSSQKDSLTDLLNRYAYNYLAKRILVSAQHENSKLAFFFIDIDNFKDINDIYGHQEGDRVLIEVSKLLKSIFPKPAIVGRYGGDEFIVIYPDFEENNEVEKIGDTLCKGFRKIETKHMKMTISCSVGISILPEHSNDLDELIHFSDLALYYAKHLGKDQYYIFDKNNKEMGIAYSRIKPENQKIDRQEMLELILENDNTAILVTDASNYRLVYANKAYCDLYNILEQDFYVENKPCYSIINGYLEPCKDCILHKDVPEFAKVMINNKPFLRRTKKIKWNNSNVYISYYSQINDDNNFIDLNNPITSRICNKTYSI
jgi:diguanylate cyclase (GGDEF)-like protein